MFSTKIVKASIRSNFCEAHEDTSSVHARRITFTEPLMPVLLLLGLLMLLFSGSLIAQSNKSSAPASTVSSVKQINLVISASSAIAVDRFYGKALGLTRLPDINIDDAYPIMRYHLENSGVISELHFVIAREKLAKLKGGASTARGFRLLSLSLPQAKKSLVLRRLHISGRNPMLETRTSANGEAYEFGSVFDADGNQVNIHFVSDKYFAVGHDLFQFGLFVKNRKLAKKSIVKSIETLFCGVSEVKDCGFKALPIQLYQAQEGLDVWSATPDKKIGFSLIQVRTDKVSQIHQELLKRKPSVAVSDVSKVSATGKGVKNSFLLTLSEGLLLELVEPE